ncbi:MAG: 3-deoxy-manno-octulosonate cytidylyltransferase [Thermodesulfovibrionales bacterium]|jgi:3-deoxy-manno-octulosonate cytidylyltransferase (CMP-KDO synthetase)|nr:3-deoxy-manno-octulosonate cytidylyltransferase [Thermodesulfovibrionales bacterium]
MPAIVIIPSRYASSRFPGKPLCLLAGKPMIRHVYERAREARLVQDVFVATDNKLIYETVEGFGGKAIMTSEAHPSGTDRIAEAVEKLQATGYMLRAADIIVNVQGDEPMIYPQMIDDVISLMDDERASMGTLAKRIEEEEEIFDPNIVKVVFNAEGFALYFSRSPIPFHRDEWKDLKHLTIHGSRLVVFKHIGIYAYRKDVLLSLSKLPSTRLEEIEKLEQLRALENGFRIKVKETEFETIGIDTPMDLERVERCLSISL